MRAHGPGWAALVVALTLGLPGPAQADPLLLDRPDLHAHFWLSYGLALTTTEVLEGPQPAWGPGLGTPKALLIGSGAVGALGLAKEFWLDDRVDTDDLLADLAGLAANALLQCLVDF